MQKSGWLTANQYRRRRQKRRGMRWDNGSERRFGKCAGPVGAERQHEARELGESLAPKNETACISTGRFKIWWVV